MESNFQQKCRQLVRSLSFTAIMSYFDLKDILVLQQLCKFIYEIGIPRSLYLIPIVFQRPYGVLIQFAYQVGITTINPRLQKFENSRLKFEPSTTIDSNTVQSIRATQMPNGRIFFIYAIQSINQNRYCQIFELNQKQKQLESKVYSSKHFFQKGACTSTIGEIFITGSKVGRCNQAARVSFRGSDQKFSNLPDLQFGRYDHAMTVLNHRFLYVFGGKFLKNHYQSSDIFERYDIKHGAAWELIQLHWDSQLRFQINFQEIAMTNYSQDEIIIFSQNTANSQPIVVMYNETEKKCRPFNLYAAKVNRKRENIAARFNGVEPVIVNSYLKQDGKDIYCFTQNAENLIRIQVQGKETKVDVEHL